MMQYTPIGGGARIILVVLMDGIVLTSGFTMVANRRSSGKSRTNKEMSL